MRDVLRPGEPGKRLCHTVEDSGTGDGTRALYGAHIYASMPGTLWEILKPGYSSRWLALLRISKSHGLKVAKTLG